MAKAMPLQKQLALYRAFTSKGLALSRANTEGRSEARSAQRLNCLSLQAHIRYARANH
jgi:hypothetical protein